MILRRDEQRLERRQEEAGTGAGAAGLVAAADRGADRGPSRDGERVPEGGRDRGAPPGRPAAGVAAKTGHHEGVSTDPGPSKPATTAEVSTDSGRQNRPPRRGCPPTLSGRNGRRAGPGAKRQRLRAVPRADRGGARRAAATRWRSGRTWSTTTASRRGYASVKRFVRKLRGSTPARRAW